MFKRQSTGIWLLIAALLLMLLGGGAMFIKQHWRASVAEAHDMAESELGLLASLVRVELQNGNYQLAGEILKNWGEEQADVVDLRLVSANGVTIGEYRRATPTMERIVVETMIPYSYTGQAGLILGKDLAVISNHHKGIIVQLGIALAIVAAMLISLTHLLLLLRGESASLKMEMARREEAQRALRESEERYRVQIEHAPEAIVVFDADSGGFVDANGNAERLFGLPREELLRRSPADLSPPMQPDGRASAEAAMAWTREALDGGTPVFEWIHRDMEGRDIPCELRLLRMPASRGNLVRGSITEITERKRTEHALRESEMRFRFLFEQVPTIAVQGYAPDGRVRYWNKASEDLYGYTKAEAIGGNLVDLIIPPPLREKILGDMASMAASGQAVPTEELRLTRKDGSPVTVFSSHVVLDTVDSGRELYCLDVDMTESRAGEALLRQDREQQMVLREMLEDVVKGGTLQGTLEACLARLLKVSWLALLPNGGIFLMGEDGRTLRLIVSNNLSPEIQSLCDHLPLGRCHCGRAAASREMQFSHCLDHHHEISYPGMVEHGHYNLPLLSEGDVLGVMVLYLPHGFERDALKEQFLGSVADVLASFIRRKHAEEALGRLNEELEGRVQLRTVELLAAKVEAERASRAKSEFLSRMSHELRTPLNAILGFGQLLELEIREEEQADNVREILHAGHHLLDLINEVLDLARIEAGRLSLSQEPIPIMPLVEECLALIRPQAEARAIHVVGARRDCDEHVRADRVRLKQVLLNLLSNAVKYNREGGSLDIVCVHEGDTLQIRVSDTGTGLTTDQQARLFVAFERLDADRHAIEGTGIGLALSKRLVELMQGEIGLESTPGEGSTFWVRLAMAEGHREPPPPTTAEPDEPAARAGAPTRRDVLCIEDNPANLRLVERILSRREDIRLLSAGTPALGLELAAAQRPALILLDINLPDMDGYEVMKCLRESPATRDIPVVAVSANAMPGDLARGKAAGFADYLTKPLEVDRLLRVMDDIVVQSAGWAVHAASRDSTAPTGGEPDNPDFSGER